MGTAEIVAIATAIVAALLGAIAHLWRALLHERSKRSELETHLNREHKRDLRRALGWPTSLDPPPVERPPVIRDDRPRAPRAKNQPRK